jgi:hypothetical protein
LKAFSPTSCKLTVGTESLSKMSGGLMELEIDPTEKAGTLNFKLPKLPKVETGQDEPGTAEKVKDALTPDKLPTNPPEIEVRDFIDELPDHDKDPIEFKVALQIGFLEPHTEVRGGLRRLNNLGCKIPLPDATTADDDATKAVIKSYQLSKAPKAVPSGLIADLLTGLQTDHDVI